MQGVPKNYFTVPGAAATNPPNSGVVTAVFPATSGYFGGGTGESWDRYIISERQHFKNIALFPDKHYILVEDIELTERGGNWIPIPVFKGDLNGSGYAVWFEGIRDDSQKKYAGLFRVNLGVITNLDVSGTMEVTGDGVFAGMIAGLNKGSISHCTASRTSWSKGGSIMINNDYCGSSAGGIAGENNGDIKHCINYGDIYSEGGIDGIAAVNHGVLMYNQNHGQLLP